MVLTGRGPDSRSVAATRLLQIIEHEFRDGLEAAREVRAAGPAPDPEVLRRAYLDLLKLCLCDLAGTSTTSVARTQDGLVMSRELSGEKLRMRAAGMDWPLHGLTMVGLRRLDDLQACVESVVREGVAGDMIEAGSWRGGASLFMRAVLDTLGESDRTVWVSDSFQGFPSADGDLSKGYDLSLDLAGCDFLAVPVDEVKDTFARFGCEQGVEFLPGFFQHTLPKLGQETWSLVRVDGDTYDSVQVALQSLYPNLSPGGYLIVDDYGSLEQCREAVQDFRSEHGITAAIEEVDWSGVRWRRGSTEEVTARIQTPAGESDSASELRSVVRTPRARVPAIEEVELQEENQELRARLCELDAEISRLTASPLNGARAWLERRRGRTRQPQP